MTRASHAKPSAPTPEIDRKQGHRREHARFSVDLDVSLGSEHNFYSGFAENLSVGGVFVATHRLRAVGDSVEICVHLPDGSEVHAVGEVRWVRVFNAHSDTPPGMGLHFLKLEPGSEQAIQKFLREREPIFYDGD
ncbi:MAG TPA: TIGR02266 family protein [Polyangiaceae bacterium]|nr:TIGR02266 family protein [Polyangiaceae bacterium]